MEAADSDDAFAAGLSELTAVVLSTPNVEGSLRDIAAITTRILPGRPMVAITLRRGGDIATVASTGPHATLLDELHISGGLGPCLHALDTAQPVDVPDLTAETRWGDYPHRMLARGVAAVHAEPLLVDGAAVGSLNLYSPLPHGFDQHALRAITLTAAHTAVLLSAAITMADQSTLTRQLQAAMASRSLIDQAIGIIMGQRRCDRDTAFETLRARSQQRNVKLVVVAGDTIRSRTGTEPAAPHFNPPSQPGLRRGKR
ncbi:GAF and ANTAR domain-containing protein [Nocardia uniformis]|uniref:GAF and ANTAR domain-containing protein n=1 Tax=Nocardia uniformis TaxID=53432 RepID=A0A849C740_9NOCA|nr:GAF and ANTAR domain-containing protein [Nocardia uniformis]NNH73568.1 GAF and ANTAR domain-containing protein [Nocardia uniformis]